VISLFFLNSLLPVLSRHIKEKSERLSELIQYSLNFLYALGAPIVVGGFLMAYQLVYLIADKKYLTGYEGLEHGSDYVMKVLVFAICLSFVNSLFGYLLVASGRQTKLLWINATCLAFNMLTNLYIIPRWSYVGAAYTTVASEFLVLILTYSVARHYLGFRTRILPLLQVTASALGMGVIIYFLRDPMISVLQNKAILLIIPLAGVIYAGMLFATGVINKDILALLRKKEHTVTLEENT
jgi:O-antigen/teichoic acid export membrane protein